MQLDDSVRQEALDLPDDYGTSDEVGAASGPSLGDDIHALLTDGKTYLEAEIAYQKSRAGFTADRLKGVFGFGLLAVGLLHLALIAVTVGILLALIPYVGALAATAIVTVALVGGAVVLLKSVKKRVSAISKAFSEDRK